MKTKTWILLVGTMFLLSLIGSFFVLRPRPDASLVQISSGGKIVKTVNLHENQQFTVTSENGGVNVITGNLDRLINWGRSNSLWSLTFATSCCGIEFMACGCARYDFARFGFEVTRNSPRQADLIMCAGTITHKMAPVLKRLYDEMAEPKYVIAVGGCAISGGPFKQSYHVVRGIDEFLPVDVYIPGCPPRPEAILYGMMQLQRKVKVEKFFGGVNKKEKSPEPFVLKDIPARIAAEMKKAAQAIKDNIKQSINDSFK